MAHLVKLCGRPPGRASPPLPLASGTRAGDEDLNEVVPESRFIHPARRAPEVTKGPENRLQVASGGGAKSADFGRPRPDRWLRLPATVTRSPGWLTRGGARGVVFRPRRVNRGKNVLWDRGQHGPS